ncbi:MAG TPA: hypothetical protein VMV31_03925 [Terriglobales bacterium]|nr:hypothetical protein [Terriglobales bacterium]
MRTIEKSSLGCSLALLALLLLAPAPARAVDGVTLISSTTTSALLNCPAMSSFQLNLCRSGSYRLAGNFVAASGYGIAITAPNVTLDLNGFSITAGANGGISAIYGATDRLTVENGKVDGFSVGITLSGAGERVDRVAVNALGAAVEIGAGAISHCIATGGGVNTAGLTLNGDGALRDNVVTGFAYGLVARGNDQISGNQVAVVVTGAETVAVTIGTGAVVNLFDNQITGPVAMQISGQVGYGANTFQTGGANPALILSGGSATSMNNNACLGAGPC